MSAELAWLLFGCFVGAFCSGVAGFAFNLIAAGILAHVLPPQETAPALIIGSLLVQSATLTTVWPAVRWPAMRAYVIAGIAGTPIGTALLIHLDGRVIATGIGVLLILYAGFMLARTALRLAPPRIAAGTGADAGVGFMGGVLGGVGGFSGALPTIWTDLRGLRKDEARAIYQPFIVVMQAAATIGLIVGGLIDRRTVESLVIALPVLALGAYLGTLAYRHVPAEGFRLVLLLMLLVSGLSLVI